MAEKTTTGRLIAAVGGVLLIVSLFLSWYGVDVGGTAGQFAAAIDTSANGWQSLDIGDLVFFIVGLLAIAPAAFDIFDLEIELPFDVGFVALVGGAVSVAWIILRIIDKPGPDIPDIAGVDIGIGLKFGIFVGLVGAALVAFGGFKQTQEDEAGPTFTDPVSGQQYATPQAPPPAAPPAAAPPAQAPPAAAPPQPQAPPPANPPQPPQPPAPPAV
ncbi:MAG: hypothetical protein JHC98_10105 [Thermoleophilaceae bacterium]|nr:hypothetical protein [Thermoleophilaceae bacterium]